MTAISRAFLRPRRKRRDAHVVGPFLVERKTGERWIVVSSHRSSRAAEDRAWALLALGGDVRVRQGASLIAEGTRVRPPNNS